MTPIIIRILLFMLIPAGIFLLVQGIRWISKVMGAAVLLSIPLTQHEATFTLPKEGRYAIWQKGRKIRKVAVAMPAPFIYNEHTRKNIQLEYPFARVSSNNGRTGKVRVFTFRAPAGQYRYQLSSETSTRDTFMGKLRTQINSDTSDCLIEVKENSPAWLLVACILVLILSGFCIILGLVFTLNPGAFTVR